jgi:hypothetical protein
LTLEGWGGWVGGKCGPSFGCREVGLGMFYVHITGMSLRSTLFILYRLIKTPSPPSTLDLAYVRARRYSQVQSVYRGCQGSWGDNGRPDTRIVPCWWTIWVCSLNSIDLLHRLHIDGEAVSNAPQLLPSRRPVASQSCHVDVFDYIH